MERYRLKVHEEGAVIIPAEVRRKFGIADGSYIELIVDEDEIKIVVPKALTSAFGIDGEKGLKVVENIVASRRAEVETEVRNRC